MGIQAVKGVEIGDGFALAQLRGSQAHDELLPGYVRETNRAGGIEAGVSNGEEIVVRAAMKPLPTLMRPLRSVDLTSGDAGEALVERSDVAAVEALAVVAEAAVAFELARAAGTSSAATRPTTSSRPGARTWSGSRGPALDRHLALIGFMGAGKTTLGEQVAARLGRPFVDLDRELERETGEPIATLFRQSETDFRIREAKTIEALEQRKPAVLALGGGAVTSESVRSAARARVHGPARRRRRRGVGAFARWGPPAGTGRAPLPGAVHEAAAALRRERRRARHRRRRDHSRGGGRARGARSFARLGELTGRQPLALVADANLARLYEPRHVTRSASGWQRVISSRPASRRRRSKWSSGSGGPPPRPRRCGGRARRRLRDRCRRVCGGDVPARRRLVLRTDVARCAGGRRDRRQDRDRSARRQEPRRHVPLASQHDRRRRAAANAARDRAARRSCRGREDRAARRRTALELEDAEPVRSCAAYKAAVCLRDPHDRGERATSTSATRSRTRSRQGRALRA